MLRWIASLISICGFSIAAASGYIVPVSHGVQSALFTLTALTAALLVSSFDAFETAAAAEADDEH